MFLESGLVRDKGGDKEASMAIRPSVMIRRSAAGYLDGHPLGIQIELLGRSS